MESSKLETIFDDIGPFGRYQKIRFFLYSIPAGLLCAFGYNIILFMSYIPEHKCKLPANGSEMALAPSSLQTMFQKGFNRTQMLKYTRPKEEFWNQEIWARCDMFNFKNYTAGQIIESVNSNSSHLTTIPCPYGNEYGNEFGRTIITEWDLVCENDYVRNLIMSLASFLGLLGLLTFSFIQDKIGRKITFFIILAWYLVFGILAAVMPTAISFGIIWTLKSMSHIPVYQVPFILVLEIVGPEQRTLVNAYFNLIFSLSQPLVTLIAYYCRDYVYLTWISVLPAAPFLLLWFICDESPRWLLSVGKTEKAIAILKKMAKSNKASITDEALETMTLEVVAAAAVDKPQEDEGKVDEEREGLASNVHTTIDEHKQGRCYKCSQIGFVQLFIRRNLALKTLILTYMWIVCFVVYNGLALSAETFMTFDRYVIYAILCVVEIPALYIMYLLLDRLGRIMPMSISIMLVGIFSMITAYTPPGHEKVAVAFFLVTKFFITGAFQSMYQVGGELFPTVVRGTGIGFGALVSGAFGTVTPFILFAAIQHNMPQLPMIIFGVMSIVGGVAGLFLPETCNKALPDTIDESETQMPLSFKVFLDNITLRTTMRCIKEFRAKREQGKIQKTQAEYAKENNNELQSLVK